MSPPQGLLYYAGSTHKLLAATFTLSSGVGPSTATLQIAPPSSPIPRGGDIVITYGSVQIPFPDCCTMNSEINYDQDGYQTVTLTIMDGRWRWRYPRISGVFNTRLGTGEIRPDTISRPREIAELLLKTMKVEKYDLSQMPNNTFPQIEWEVERADTALSRLCDEVGARVVYCPGGVVRICQAGQGGRLPTMNALDADIRLDAPEIPDEIRFVGARSVWEAFFELEAVAIEKNGDVVPLDKVSYRPKKNGELEGFENWYLDGSQVEDPKERALALESVYRWYRIKTPFKTPKEYGQNGEYEVKDLNRILPIYPRRAATRVVDGKKEYLQAAVYGAYTAGHEITDVEMKRFTVAPKKGGTVTESYMGDFEIDADLGIVKFKSSTYILEKLTRSGKELQIMVPAKVVLLTSYSLRDEKHRGWLHEQHIRQVTQQPKGKRPKGKKVQEVISRNDAEAPHYLNFEGDKWVEKYNRKDFEKEADFYIDSHIKSLIQSDPVTATWAGIVPIAPDGAIQQITWFIGRDGHSYTRASRNREEPSLDQTYRQRRIQDRLLELMEGKDKDKTKGAKRA